MQVFFYGLFMDRRLLAAKGIEPQSAAPGSVDGFRLEIGARATLVPHAGSRAWGVVMDVAPAAAQALYADDSVLEYVPEPVTVELKDGKRVAATCYNLPGGSRSGTNPEYAKALLELATELGLPDDYLDGIRRAGVK